MLKQKRFLVPTVSYAPVTDWNAATSFTSDPIEFPETVEWSLDIEGYSGMIAGSPTISILCSNQIDGEYKPYKTAATSVDIKVLGNRLILDDTYAPRFMKIQYVSGGSTGTFSLILSK